MKIDHNKIESLLNQIHKSDYYVMPFADDFNSNIEYKIYVNHIEIMIEEFGLINHFKTKSSTLYLTKFGKSVISHYGGWSKYLEIDKIKSDRIERKNIFDFRISKFKYFTFWPVFIFAFVGFVFSVFNFINNQENQENAKLQEQQIEQMEVELTKLQTSILNQKNLDSLRNSKELTKKIEK